ncbi:putative tyrosine specific protein phosphatase [Trypanosoma conorhini]|uniref:Putative tyrosine specific protein phosphatase n=1 Tax=Trypanosoma conorhini TaxID=83891 RepID=A0A3R7NAC7_9TRYP|nr:putative tyrosine specific protein phosphatase [Trypanosoma conorhini]RNE99498.1 putative tyrosine specific protein phosphatase [Trypanosoma conorhini]
MRFSTAREGEEETRHGPGDGTGAPTRGKQRLEMKPSAAETLRETSLEREGEHRRPPASTSAALEPSPPPVSIIITPQEAGTARNSDPTFLSGSGDEQLGRGAAAAREADAPLSCRADAGPGRRGDPGSPRIAEEEYERL